jgi:Skp family chaperone for outer membrane proteins
LYIDYIKKYEKGVSLLMEKSKKDKEFINLLKAARLDQRSKGLELRDLLSKPFQRIFAYKNIFNRLLELTPKESTSFQPIEKLVNEMEDLVQALNQAKRRFENEQKIQRISSEWGESQERLQKYLLKNWRKYIREGRLKVSVNQEPMNWADCFLANDVFIAITENGLKPIYLCFTKIQTDHGSGAQSPPPTNTAVAGEDDLFIKLDSFPVSCRIKFADNVEKNQWMQDFNKCIAAEENIARTLLKREPSEMLSEWLNTINDLPNAHQLLNDVSQKLRGNADELDKINAMISSLQQEVKERLTHIAGRQQQKRGLQENKQKAKKDHTAHVKNLQKLLERGENLKRDFEKLLRRDKDAFIELFSTTNQTLDQFKGNLYD